MFCIFFKIEVYLTYYISFRGTMNDFIYVESSFSHVSFSGMNKWLLVVQFTKMDSLHRAPGLSSILTCSVWCDCFLSWNNDQLICNYIFLTRTRKNICNEAHFAKQKKICFLNLPFPWTKTLNSMSSVIIYSKKENIDFYYFFMLKY